MTDNPHRSWLMHLALVSRFRCLAVVYDNVVSLSTLLEQWKSGFLPSLGSFDIIALMSEIGR